MSIIETILFAYMAFSAISLVVFIRLSRRAVLVDENGYPITAKILPFHRSKSRQHREVA